MAGRKPVIQPQAPELSNRQTSRRNSPPHESAGVPYIGNTTRHGLRQTTKTKTVALSADLSVIFGHSSPHASRAEQSISPELQHELRSLLVSVLVDAAKEVLPLFAQVAVPEARSAAATVNEPERLLRPREAAKVFGISERSLWKLVSSGQLSCVRIGRSVRYDPAALRGWIDKARSPQMAIDSGQRRSPVQHERRAVEGGSKRPSKANRQRNAGAVPRPDKPSLESRVKIEGTQDRVDAGPRDVRGFFAKRLGLRAERFRRLTNGDLMRAAEVDIATMHNWIYRGGELPEPNLQKLEDFFRGIASRQGQDG